MALYVSTKVEVDFLFQENRGHGTDGRTDRQTNRRTWYSTVRPAMEGHMT